MMIIEAGQHIYESSSDLCHRCFDGIAFVILLSRNNYRYLILLYVWVI